MHHEPGRIQCGPFSLLAPTVAGVTSHKSGITGLNTTGLATLTSIASTSLATIFPQPAQIPAVVTRKTNQSRKASVKDIAGKG